MENPKEESILASNEFLRAYFIVGLLVVAISLRFIWGEGGLMAETFTSQRMLTVILAIVFGFGLGWLFYPRRLHLPSKD